MEYFLPGIEESVNKPFTSKDKMRKLIASNPFLLPVLSRFGIALGFGDSVVSDVCRRDCVDVVTFLAVCNFFSSRPTITDDV